MIDPKELRIGNWVRTTKTGSLRQSDSAQDTEDYEVIEFELEHGDFYNWIEYALDDDWLEPIPITTEWLERLGLHHIKTEATTFGSMTGDDGSEEYWQKGPVIIKKFGDEFQTVFGVFVTIKTVHQLMNLFHALTGTELKVKQPETT